MGLCSAGDPKVSAMARTDRVDLIRSGYERLNEQDLESILVLVTHDIEWPDAVNNSVLHGTDELRGYFRRMFAFTRPRVTVGDVIEIGDAVVATTYQQFYDLEGKLLGGPRMVINRFNFCGDLVCSMVVTSHEDFPEELRRRFQDC